MTLEELVDAIYKSGCDKVDVDRLKHVTGNTDQSGNYTIVRLTMGDKVLKFTNESGAWAKG